MGKTCAESRAKYVAVQDDLPEGWSIGSTLNMIGLGAIAPGAKNVTPTIDPEVAKEMFAKLYAILSSADLKLNLEQTRKRDGSSPCHLRLHPRKQAILLQLRLFAC